MDRLTEKQSSGYDLKAMNGEWCNKYCEQQRVQTCNDCVIYQAIQKLAEYENLEEQGLLLRLPCKVGDIIYKPNPITLSEIVGIKIESIFITESEINISGRTIKMKYSFCCSPSDFGKTVFLTQEEAEQKLKELKEMKNKIKESENND